MVNCSYNSKVLPPVGKNLEKMRWKFSCIVISVSGVGDWAVAHLAHQPAGALRFEAPVQPLHLGGGEAGDARQLRNRGWPVALRQFQLQRAWL